ncbi:glycosyltransferase family 2 protein [Candidatus Ruminimicrobium bovinum]|uniref:glycosyltransferase family 2 protein n=1 Tax=Candidatus Ruminimicrobium bovinum TaxID=3242779 RepID=UPI0039B82671
MISVIIAAKNASKYIRETIESIRKQNIKDIEIIVVCDSCTDNTKQIAQEFCCKVAEVNFSCISKTRNAGLNFASGEYILYIDADDILNENSIFALYNEFIKDTSIEAVFGMTQDFISPELSDTDKTKLKARTDNYFGMLAGASLIKRNVFEKIGTFNESLKSGEIIDFQIRLKQKNINIKKIPVVISKRRLHNDNFGRTNKQQEFKDYLSILRTKINKQN